VRAIAQALAWMHTTLSAQLRAPLLVHAMSLDRSEVPGQVESGKHQHAFAL